jgi:hypothetical protein
VSPTGLEDKQRPDFRQAWHRVLVYFGLADNPPSSGAAPQQDTTSARLRALEQRADEQAREITALREELDRLGGR